MPQRKSLKSELTMEEIESDPAFQKLPPADQEYVRRRKRIGAPVPLGQVPAPLEAPGGFKPPTPPTPWKPQTEIEHLLDMESRGRVTSAQQQGIDEMRRLGKLPPPRPRVEPTFKGAMLPGIGATVGAIFGGPAGAGALGFGGEMLRQELSERFPGAGLGAVPEDVFGALSGGVIEGAVEGGLEKGFGILSKGRQAIKARRAARAPIDPAAAGVEAAGRLDVPLTVSQATQSQITSSIEKVVERALFVSKTSQKKQLRQIGAMNREINTLLDSVATKLPREQSGEALSLVFREVDNQVRRRFDEIESAIPTNLALTPTSKQSVRLRKLAKELDDFGNKVGSRLVRRFLKGAESGETIHRIKLINKIVGSGPMSPDKGALSQAKIVAQDMLLSQIQQEGLESLASDYRAIRSEFRTMKGYFEDRAIKKMLDADRPEGLAPLLVQRSTGVTTARKLKSFARRYNKPELVSRAQRSALEELFEKASTEGGAFTKDVLEKRIKAIGEDTLQALLTKEQFTRLTDIKEIANVLALPASVTAPISAQSPSLLAMGQSAGITGALIGGGYLIGEEKGALLGLLTPPILAKLLISPNGTKLLRAYLVGKKSAAESAKALLRVTAAMYAPELGPAGVEQIKGLEMGRVEGLFSQQGIPEAPR